jgi:positive regulator of sigma E activity
MANFFRELFSDDNSINEKSVIGVSSFVVMIIFAVFDIITGYLGKDLVINETIFNAFLIMTLGAFGIASVDKYINKKSSSKDEEEIIE